MILIKPKNQQTTANTRTLGKLILRFGGGNCWFCSVLNKLTLLKFEIHMEELKKKYTPYTESERMSYIREYLSTSESTYKKCLREE